jgi:hypothetical protein
MQLLLNYYLIMNQPAVPRYMSLFRIKKFLVTAGIKLFHMKFLRLKICICYLFHWFLWESDFYSFWSITFFYYIFHLHARWKETYCMLAVVPVLMVLQGDQASFFVQLCLLFEFQSNRIFWWRNCSSIFIAPSFLLLGQMIYMYLLEFVLRDSESFWLPKFPRLM